MMSCIFLTHNIYLVVSSQNGSSLIAEQNPQGLDMGQAAQLLGLEHTQHTHTQKKQKHLISKIFQATNQIAKNTINQDINTCRLKMLNF